MAIAQASGGQPSMITFATVSESDAAARWRAAARAAGVSGRAPGVSSGHACECESYRVGPKVSSWPKILTVNPY